MFGVSIADLKLIAKQIKGQQQLALDLFETGNLDAMYLAQLVANGKQMSRSQLQDWAKRASGLTMGLNTRFPQDSEFYASSVPPPGATASLGRAY